MRPNSAGTRHPTSTRRGRLARLALLSMLAVALLASEHAAVAQEPPAEPGAITWGIRPSSPTGPDGRDRFDLVLDPGASIEDYVGVSNFTDAPLELAVYATDAFTTADGSFDLLPAAEEPVDAGAWVSFAEERVIVPPRSRLDIPFQLTVPANATPGDHAAGIVASHVTSSDDGSGNPVAVDRRVGARIYLRVSGDIAPSASITDVSIDHSSSGLGGEATVTYTVANTGNLRLTGTPTISVAGPFGIGRQQTDGPEIEELLPGNELSFTATVDGVRPLVRLRATVELEPEGVGDDTPFPSERTSATTWAIPWLYLGLLLVAVLVVTFLIRRRRRRRRNLAEQLESARAEGRAEALVEADSGEEAGPTGEAESAETSGDAGPAEQAVVGSPSGPEGAAKQ